MITKIISYFKSWFERNATGAEIEAAVDAAFALAKKNIEKFPGGILVGIQPSIGAIVMLTRGYLGDKKVSEKAILQRIMARRMQSS